MAAFFDFTPCPDCRGTGGNLEKCPFCVGTGRLLTAEGVSEKPCAFCHGKGERRSCDTCHGAGHLPPALVGEIERKRREKT